MSRTILKAVATICLALMTTFCIMVMDPERPAAWQPRGEFRKTVEFASGRSLVVENGAGDIEIVGGEEEVLEVVAQGSAGFPLEGRGIRAYGFWNHRPDIDIRETAGGYRVRLRSLDGPGRPSRVDLRIRVPHSVCIEDIRAESGNISVSDTFGRIAVSLGRGDMTIRNYSGPVDISVGSGTVDVEVLDLRDEDSIDITTGEGDIVLRLEAGAGARIEARAANGAVRSDFDLGAPSPAPEVSGRVGSGGAAVNLETRGGNIDILVIKEVVKNHG